MSDAVPSSSGVQELIDRLQEEGVRQGEEAAGELLTAARAEAMELVDAAKREADTLVRAAQEEATRTKQAGEEAIRLAGRDAILKLTEELRVSFRSTLHRLVGERLQDTEFLQRLILAIAGEAVPAGDPPLHVLFLQSDTVDEGDRAELDAFVKSLAGQSLRNGLTFEVSDSDVPGVRIQVVDEELEIDLTDATLTHLLLERIAPRMRAIMQG